MLILQLPMIYTNALDKQMPDYSDFPSLILRFSSNNVDIYEFELRYQRFKNLFIINSGYGLLYWPSIPRALNLSRSSSMDIKLQQYEVDFVENGSKKIKGYVVGELISKGYYISKIVSSPYSLFIWAYPNGNKTGLFMDLAYISSNVYLLYNEFYRKYFGEDIGKIVIIVGLLPVKPYLDAETGRVLLSDEGLSAKLGEFKNRIEWINTYLGIIDIGVALECNKPGATYSLTFNETVLNQLKESLDNAFGSEYPVIVSIVKTCKAPVELKNIKIKVDLIDIRIDIDDEESSLRSYIIAILAISLITILTIIVLFNKSKSSFSTG